jgi:glyoxylase-like metal-dependent hydrolase (beta-lactamase superfamily II)
MPDKSPLSETDPVDDGIYQVFSLCYARAADRRVHENFLRRDMHDGPMPLDFNVWIVRNAQRTILVDTGFGQRAAAERARPLDIDPLDALRRIGIDPDSIQDVVLTHLHYDHAGNIDRFAKARFHVQDAEVEFATGRCMCHSVLRFPYDVRDVVALVGHTYAERVCFHDGIASPLPGISLHRLPGHSRGLQAVKVVTKRGPILLASDASHYYANFLRHAPFSLTVDVAPTLRSYDELVSLAGSVDRIIPGHDPRVRALYPSLNVGGVELLALHEPPKPHTAEELSRLPARLPP